MPNFVITSTTTVAQSLTNGQYGYVASDGELVVSGEDAIVGSGSVQLAVLGNVTSFGDFNTFDFDGVDLDMVVGAAGSMLSLSDNALDLVASSRIEVTNLGAINADGIAISAATSDTGTAINIFNAGTLNGSTAISVNSGTGSVIISNTGSMFTNGTAISVSGSTGATFLNNSGLIESAGSFSIFLSNGNDALKNTGTIIGNVLLGSGNDTYDGTYGFIQGRVDGANGDDTIIGGAFAETFRGGNDEDYINAGGGNDTIQGTDYDAANDVYDGGAGVDTLEVNSDSNDLTVDLLAGYASGGIFGVDRLISIENVVSGNGDDELIGNAEDNSLNGGANSDTLIGGGGADELIGGQGFDTADYSTSGSGVTIRFWNGTGIGGDAQGDRLIGIEAVIGSNHNDMLLGALGVGDHLNGGAGNDYLNGLSGDDTLIGGAGADILDGGAGIDIADYSASGSGVTVRLWNGTGVGGDAQGDTLSGIEYLTGSNHNDLLFGALDSDEILYGGGGNDYLDGLSGDDTLIGGAGADILEGGAGNDNAEYLTSGSGVTVRLWNGTGVGGDAQGDTLSGIETVTGSNHNDLLLGALGSGDTLNGEAGNDYLDGLSGNDVLNGGDNNDTLVGGAGADTLDGGAGTDIADYSASGSGVTVRLWNGTGVGGDAQGDTLSGIETVTGSNHNDLLFGAIGAEDRLNGGAGNDYLNGLSGDDVLNGGANSDTLEGGAGADVFVFGAGFDENTVSDFEDTTDTVFLAGGLTFGDLTITALGGGIGFRAAVTADTSDYIDLLGVGMTIDAADFV